MKPIRLQFAAFGAYPGHQEVDFELLAQRGLYVVSGPTGSGKSTIFDAMTFALYGVLPGARLVDGDRVIRSHHADSQPSPTDTYVEFEFEVDNARYVVRRSPRYERPKKGGKGNTIQQATADLTRIGPDGTTTSIATKTRQSTEKCTQLLGLGPEQFQRVVLLPQGRFAEFLLAKSTEREELLKQLFGNEVYERTTQLLGEEAKDLELQLRDARSRLRNHLTNAAQDVMNLYEALKIQTLELTEAVSVFGPEEASQGEQDEERPGFDADELRKYLDHALQPLDELDLESKTQQGAAVKARQEHERLKGEATRFDQAQQHQEQLDGLEAQADDIANLRRAVDASSSARPVVIAEERRSTLAEELAAAKRTKGERLKLVGQQFEALGCEFTSRLSGSASAVVAELEKRREATKDDRRLLEELDAARLKMKAHSDQFEAASKETERKEEEKESKENRRVEIQQVLVLLQESASQLEVAEQRTQELVGSIDNRQKLEGIESEMPAAIQTADRASEIHRQAMAAFVATQAPRLAEKLESDKPCPVCGSLEHPLPATLDEEQPVDYEEVERKRGDLNAASEKLARIKLEVAEIRGVLGKRAEVSMAELKTEHVEAERLVEKAKADDIRLVDLSSEEQRLVGELEDLESELKVLKDDETSVRALLKKDAEEEEAAQRQAGHLDEKKVAEAEAAISRLSGLSSGLDVVFQQAVRAQALFDYAERAFAGALSTSQFETDEAARSVCLPQEVEDEKREGVRVWDLDLDQAKTILNTLQQQGVPDERPDLHEALNMAEAAEKALQQITRRHQDAITSDNNAQRELEKHDEEKADTSELEAKWAKVRQAHAVCNGQGRLRVTLQRWVLSGELDRVTQAANVHLGRMTANRYSIRRPQEPTDGRRAAGLELMVTDAHTGRERSTNSLSGGEQFQASLALALGLADVISQGGLASGHAYEALFVDEGFGSLDAESLEDAIQSLQQLQATGRTVGVITHVEAMKQQLPMGIQVDRLPSGQGSTLTVAL